MNRKGKKTQKQPDTAILDYKLLDMYILTPNIDMSFISTVKFCFLLLFCLCISIFDCRNFKIPDTMIMSLALILVAIDISFDSYNILHRVFNSILFFVIFFLIHKIPGGLGFGDVKFAGILSYAMDFQNSLYAFFFASLSAIIFILIKFSFFNAKTSRIPFAPFLSFGTLLTLAIRGAK